MEPDKQIQTNEKTTSFPILLDECFSVIEKISDEEYTKQTQEKNMPVPLMKLLESMDFDTVKYCIERAYDTPHIKQLSQTNPVAYRRAVKMMLAKMSWLLNIKEGLKPEQMTVIPSLLLSDYGHLRLNDINMVCKGIVTGKYKIYERLDVETFFRCLREYDASDERIQAREDYNRKGKGILTIHPDIAKELGKDIKKIGKGQTLKDAKISMNRAVERLKQEKEKGERHD